MQLSAANLIIASQQIARGAAKPAADGGQFAQALAKEGGVKEMAAFETLDFKQAPAPAKASAAAPAQAPATGYGAAGPLGGNLDIRV
jgi:hypothetical protein